MMRIVAGRRTGWPTRMQMAAYLVLVALMVQTMATPAAAQQRAADRDKDDEAQEQIDAADRAALLKEGARAPRALEGPIDPDTYVLGPMDELLVVVHGPQIQTYFLKVLPEGNIVLPNAGPFMVAGMTLTEFREAAAGELKRYYPGVDIDIQLSNTRTFLLYVTGEVDTRGPVELFPPFRISNAIRLAGGPSDRAGWRQIEIREGGEVVRTVDLFAFLYLGKGDENPVLKEGQTVHVPPRGKIVNMIGEVKKQGTYELLPGETAADLIEYAGGITVRGYAEQILLERTKPGQPMETIMFNLAQAESIALKDLDAIIVRDIRSYDGSDPVEIIGGGGRGGAIYIGEPEKLRDFLVRMWRFTEAYDTRIAVLEHHTDEGTELTVFNVGKVFDGDPIGDMLVHPGDTVSIPPRDNAVFVAGQAVGPGPIPYQPGYTAERYISLAGGPTDAGSFDKLTIYSVTGEKRSGDRKSVIYRGDTIVLEVRTGKRIGGWLVNVTALTGLVLAIVALANTK